jgi:hypothetical protein
LFLLLEERIGTAEKFSPTVPGREGVETQRFSLRLARTGAPFLRAAEAEKESLNLE